MKDVDHCLNLNKVMNAGLTETAHSRIPLIKFPSHIEGALTHASHCVCLQELERLKEWGDVLKKVENDKLREEQDGRAKERLEAEAKWAALDKGLATAQVSMQ